MDFFFGSIIFDDVSWSAFVNIIIMGRVFKGFKWVLRDSDRHCVTVGILALDAGLRKGAFLELHSDSQLAFQLVIFLVV